MQKVLITGADGFIGSHLTELLIKEGYTVKAFVFYNSFNSWGWLDSLPKDILKSVEVIAGDICDPYGIKNALKDVDVVFHLAALIAIPFSYNSPESYLNTNVRGTLNILQAAKDLGISKVIVTSTSEVYGSALYVPIDEKHPRQAQSPYSATKIAADALAESFYRSFNLPVITVRPFNTYGPRQSARAVIPTIISQLLDGYTDIKLGSLMPTRDLVFVKDTVSGFLEISKSDNLIGQQINIATNSEISIGDLAGKIISHINPNASLISDNERLRPEKSEVNRLFGSNEKILSTTKWKQKYTLDQGLKETINWFRKKENLAKYKSNIYNI